MAQPNHPTHIEVSTPAPGDGQEIGERDAKQANRGRHIFIVLTTSLVLVVLAFIGAFAFNARPSVGDKGQATVSEATANPVAASREAVR
ncbi:MAG: hypothetical protein ABIO39_12460 [Caulobacteraceae bacterium]